MPKVKKNEERDWNLIELQDQVLKVTSDPESAAELFRQTVEENESYTHRFSELIVPFAKQDEEQRLVTGIVLEPDEVDSQGDTISAEVIRRAAHRFLSRFNKGSQLGVMHQMFGEIGVKLVESFIAPADMILGGEKVKKGSWVMTVKVVDDMLWRKIKAGDITGFSIGGVATVAES